MLRPVHALAIAAALLSPLPVHAEQPTETRVTDSTRGEVIEALGTALQENYVFPEVAESLSAELEKRLQSGAYDDSSTAADFAKMLTLDMRTIGKDGHFGVRYDPDFVPEEPGADGLPDEAEIAEMRRMVARHAYGLQRIDRLPGNIGYLDIRGFDEPYYVSAAYEAAMKLLAGSDAIIIDLRSNGGGDPASVALLMSHFFPVGTELLVNSIYDRTDDTTRQFWIDPAVETRFAGPVYVLTSSRTFSGGEEFAYDMKTHERGRLIGETTGGGANPGGTVPIAHGFVAFIPTGRAINPVTGTNWEGVGVEPDLQVPADDALRIAYAEALETVRSASDDDRRKRQLSAIIEAAADGEVVLPDWTAPKR